MKAICTKDPNEDCRDETVENSGILECLWHSKDSGSKRSFQEMYQRFCVAVNINLRSLSTKLNITTFRLTSFHVEGLCADEDRSPRHLEIVVGLLQCT